MTRLPRLIGWCLLALGLALPAAAKDPEPAWRDRVQVLYDPLTRSVERRQVTVMDLFPGQNLDFTWEPAQGNAEPVHPRTGRAQGAGRLIWRVRGMADYDTRAVYAIFSGRLEEGRPEGEGRIDIRTGESYEGGWIAGLREGEGYLRDPDGNHYRGGFVAGLPHGEGRYTARDGTLYVGSFRHGLRHGDAVVRLPGGTEYRSVWRAGEEVESDRPDVVLDAQTGGLLRAQAGDDASRVTLAPVIDRRKGGLQSLRYGAQPMDGTLAVYPANPRVIEGWNLEAPIEPFGWVSAFHAFFMPERNNAYMRISLQATDGGVVEIADVWLDVAESITERRPLLQVRTLQGCIGYRPYFGLLNHGWGAVDSATLRYRFVPEGAAEDPSLRDQGTRMFETTVAGFSEAGVVRIDSALPRLGVDTATLQNRRLRCNIPTPYDHAACVAQLRQEPAFGELAPLVGLSDNLAAVGIDGELEFSWTDARGRQKTAAQPLSASVALAWVDGVGLAEMGSAYEDYAEAPRHILVEFPLDRQNYSYPLDYRGERRVSRVDIPIKLRSSAASIHEFRAAVRFADGSVRYSQPVRLYYVRPRMEVDESALDALQPQTCFEFEY